VLKLTKIYTLRAQQGQEIPAEASLKSKELSKLVLAAELGAFFGDDTSESQTLES
jgi:hypothetical protein